MGNGSAKLPWTEEHSVQWWSWSLICFASTKLPHVFVVKWCFDSYHMYVACWAPGPSTSRDLWRLHGQTEPYVVPLYLGPWQASYELHTSFLEYGLHNCLRDLDKCNSLHWSVKWKGIFVYHVICLPFVFQLVTALFQVSIVGEGSRIHGKIWRKTWTQNGMLSVMLKHSRQRIKSKQLIWC